MQRKMPCPCAGCIGCLVANSLGCKGKCYATIQILIMRAPVMVHSVEFLKTLEVNCQPILYILNMVHTTYINVSIYKIHHICKLLV